ncbi:MAG: hypothetical protein Q4D65_10180, partial [Peptostreptococcaceae bacterium]|nr:hypothetical protein [Peptostreptococcaceae bacterium]
EMKKKIIVILAMLCLLASCAPGDVHEEKSSNYVFYKKNGEIFFTALEKVEPKQLTEKFSFDGSGEWNYTRWYEPKAVGDLAYFVDYGIEKQEDIQDLYSEGLNLYCRQLNQAGAKNVLIDKDIADYLIGEENVLYDKISGELHQWKVGGVNEMVADNLKIEYRPEYKMSKDGKRFVYLNKEGNLYLKDSGKDEFIDSNVDIIESMNDNASVLLYIKSDKDADIMYCKQSGKAIERLGEIMGMSYRTEAYFDKHRVAVAQSFPLADLVENDLEASHPLLKDWNELSEKRALNFYNIYYIGENSLEKLDGEYFMWEGFNEPEDWGQMSLRKITEKEFAKPKLSEFQKAEDVVDAIYLRMLDNSELFFPINEKSIKIQEGDSDMFNNPEGTRLYFSRNVKEGRGDLYMSDITQKEAGEPKKILENVSALSVLFAKEGKVWAYLDKEENGDETLYVDGKKTDEGIESYSADYDKENQAIYYEVPYKEDGRISELKVYRDGAVKSISKNCYHKILTESGKIIYLADWDHTSEKGKLYYYDGEQSVLLDENVEEIFSDYMQYGQVRE